MSPDWLARRRRLESVMRLQAAVLNGDPARDDILPLLAGALSDLDSDVREQAAAALSEFGADGRPAVPALIAAINDESIVVRRRAVRALGGMAEAAEDAIPALIAATEDANASVALQALASLSDLAPLSAAALPAFLTALWTGDVRFRAVAGVALVRLGSAAVPSLLQTLVHPAPEMRAKAAHILGKLGPIAAEAKPLLEKLLQDKDEAPRSAAAEALRLIAGRE
jgi:HEAT repeat protein